MIVELGRVPSDNDVRWHLYNKQIHEAARSGDWGQYRNTRFRMADLLRKENRLKDALPHYLEVCYLDLNRASPEKSILSPEIIERISNIVEEQKLTPYDIENIFKDRMMGQYSSLDLPFSPDAAWKKIGSEIFPSAQINEEYLKIIVPRDESGFYKGKHFTTYVNDVKQLIRENKLDEAENLLLELVNATENESNHDGLGVAPWYYEKLAILYRKKKDRNAETAILERFAQQKHGDGSRNPKLFARLEKLKIRDKETP